MCGSVRTIRLEEWRLLLCAHKFLAVHVLWLEVCMSPERLTFSVMSLAVAEKSIPGQLVPHFITALKYDAAPTLIPPTTLNAPLVADVPAVVAIIFVWPASARYGRRWRTWGKSRAGMGAEWGRGGREGGDGTRVGGGRR